MAGDPLRDAFRTQLAAIRTALAATYPAIFAIKDLINTVENPAPTEFIDLEFLGGSEAQYTFGAPGSNLFREEGQVTVRVCTKLGAGTTKRDLAETYATAIRAAFRSQTYRLFSAGSLTVRITSTAPMGGGFDDGGLWMETVALGYETYNTA